MTQARKRLLGHRRKGIVAMLVMIILFSGCGSAPTGSPVMEEEESTAFIPGEGNTLGTLISEDGTAYEISSSEGTGQPEISTDGVSMLFPNETMSSWTLSGEAGSFTMRLADNADQIRLVVAPAGETPVEVELSSTDSEYLLPFLQPDEVSARVISQANFSHADCIELKLDINGFCGLVDAFYTYDSDNVKGILLFFIDSGQFPELKPYRSFIVLVFDSYYKEMTEFCQEYNVLEELINCYDD
ncbi:MAG: hypothetical protein HJJLKODD_01615 [Phycisphaerae bacterium]|nr:hypothetical protein [Phycisphaerae bacterium]